MDSLKADRGALPEFLFAQRKENILKKLRRLLPGTSGDINAIRNPETGAVSTDPPEIGLILTDHWQHVFNFTPTDGELRQKWLERLSPRLDISLSELLPTAADVDLVLNSLPTSACGPDGIPFAVFRRFREFVGPSFFEHCTWDD